MNEKTPHPTQKPEELIRKFILASSQRGDTVVDPFSGSGTALVAAQQLGRHWLGCEINPEYNQWAVRRLQQVKQMTDEEWFWFDRQRQKRRQQIR
jgi:site-specific DNA-methyltransferase (adenine-specific)